MIYRIWLSKTPARNQQSLIPKSNLYKLAIVIHDIHIHQWWGASSFFSGASFIISSILRIVIAASVAKRIEFIFDIIGYNTPAFKLLRGAPLVRSRPQNLSYNRLGSASPSFWEAEWRALSLETSSVASLAALTARVLGRMFKASLNSEIAICYLVLWDLQNWSRWMLSAISTAPPPATTFPDSRVLFATQIESWSDLNIVKFTSILHQAYTR